MANEPRGGTQNGIEFVDNDEQPKPAMLQKIMQRASRAIMYINLMVNEYVTFK